MKKTIYSSEHSQVVEKLVKAREKAGLTQKQVAQSIGRTQSFISKVESGQRRVDVVLLKELAILYKVKVDDLI
ncbi:helix-turn-helix transcriptional regulator [bacterium]|nr:helix-turn-helix transcriptional regulator [bacterium]